MKRLHSEEFKKAAVQKYLTRGNRSVNDVLKEIGVASPTIYQWRDKFANVSGMKKQSRPQSRSGTEKLKAIIEFDSLPVEKQGEYLRTNGLHIENLNEWRKQIEEALSSNKKTAQERMDKSTDLKKIKELERQLRRKDKALAEASALLILKKKADLIWGSEEDE